MQIMLIFCHDVNLIIYLLKVQTSHLDSLFFAMLQLDTKVSLSRMKKVSAKIIRETSLQE